jgi:hypothetical protein
VQGARPAVVVAQAGRPLGVVPLYAPREATVVEVTRPRRLVLEEA